MAIERSLSVTEDDPDDNDESPKKKRRRAEAIGGFAVVPEKPSEASEDTSEILQKLQLTKRRAGISESTQSLTELLSIPDASDVAEREPETGEVDMSLDALSPDEKQFVEHQIVAGRRASNELPADTGEPGLEAVETPLPRAVEAFRDKILNDEQGADRAFHETIEDIQTGNIIEDSPAADGSANEVFHIPRGARIAETGSGPDESTEVYSASPHHSRNRQRRKHTPFVPSAKAAGARGTGYYSLDKMSRKGGPRKEYIPLHDELTLETIPGAIVGYLIGRRRGKGNTEKRLLPIQKKLEKQVEDIQEDIAAKELQIQKMAREAREQNKSQQNPKQQEQIYPKPAVDTEAQRSVAPEANQLHGKKPSSEKIGHVLVAANLAPEKPKETHGPGRAASKPEVAKRRAATMSRSELLELSEEITVDNTTLRHIYDTHLVSESGLRKLVYEHMHGGNMKEALHHEILEHETGFEKDPYLRYHDGVLENDRTATQREKDLHRGDNAELGRGGDESDNGKSPLSSKLSETRREEEKAAEQTSRRRVLDMSLVGIIVILLALVIVLAVSRS